MSSVRISPPCPPCSPAPSACRCAPRRLVSPQPSPSHSPHPPCPQVPQPPVKAAASRDAVARSVYGKLFESLLARINLVASASSAHSADNKRVVGLLDIFGFEAFNKNSLEQLLINFANEKLQSHFNEYIFRLEEAECKAEGVAW